ncbi:MAG: HAD family hydrolase [Lentisphaeria bacterium]|nr:HAD family hydrolase [Lentisphaeria bacterium]
MKKVFFLDRDGVIIEDANYLSSPEQVVLCPGTPEAFRMIKAAGYEIVVVSNQSGIARGYFTYDDLAKVEKHIENCLTDAGAPLPAGWYYCPHHKKGSVAEYAVDCDCRKPKPGLLLAAKKELDIDCGESFIIGDKVSDLESGFAAGCKAGVLVLTGHGTEQELKPLEKPYETAPEILEAVKLLLKKGSVPNKG